MNIIIIWSIEEEPLFEELKDVQFVLQEAEIISNEV